MFSKNHFYIFEFDAQGHLLKTDITSGWSSESTFNVETDIISPASKFATSAGRAEVLNGETVLIEHNKCVWVTGDSPVRSGFAVRVRGASGRLLLTKSKLCFESKGQFANADPVLILPLDSMAEAYVTFDKTIASLNRGGGDRWLVIRLKNGDVHSFAATGLEPTLEFIQNKIKLPEPPSEP
jgi:hypothetical protein